jgi:hypothetical protein
LRRPVRPGSLKELEEFLLGPHILRIEDNQIFQADPFVVKSFKNLIQPIPGYLVGLIGFHDIEQVKAGSLSLACFGRQNSLL